VCVCVCGGGGGGGGKFVCFLGGNETKEQNDKPTIIQKT